MPPSPALPDDGPHQPKEPCHDRSSPRLAHASPDVEGGGGAGRLAPEAPDRARRSRARGPGRLRLEPARPHDLAAGDRVGADRAAPDRADLAALPADEPAV